MELNYVALVVGAVAYFLVGMLWYSPAFFGKQWMKYMGFTEKDMKKMQEKGMGKSMLGGFVTSLITVWALMYLMWMTGTSSSAEGAMLGALIWFGFQGTSALGMVLWEGKPFGLYAIHTVYSLVALLTIGSLLPLF